MRNTIISREYVFRHEVIPLLIIGILLNLLGFFAAEKFLSGSRLFFDMGGTVFTSVLLGPWWGASVGVLTNIVNGTISSNYFPFGVVHVAGALFWGYYARAFGFGRNLPGLPRFTMPRFLIHFLVLALVGGMITGGTSSLVKSILYPIMERPWITNDSHLAMVEALRDVGVGTPGDQLIMVLMDIKRDTVDKLVSVAAITAIITWIVFLPNRFGIMTTMPWFRRIKTDNVSVLFFFICYGFYLFVARIVRPVISISGARHDLSWLTSIPVIVMLYTPIVLALLVFLLFSLDPGIKTGRLVEMDYQMKRRLYFQYSREVQGHAGSFSLVGARSLLQKYNVYGLVMSIAMWPISKMIGNSSAEEIGTFILVYVVVIVLYMFAFLLENNNFVHRVLAAQNWIGPLKKWLEINASPRETLVLGRNLKELFEKTVNITDDYPLGYKGFVYFSVSKQIKTSALVSVKDEMEGAYLVIILENPGLLTAEVRKDIEHILLLSGINQAFVLNLCPIVFDQTVKEWLRVTRSQDIQLVLLSWIDIELLIEQFVSGRFKQKGFYDAILHTLEQVGIHDSRWSRISVIPGELQDRSLPIVKHIVERLDPNSRILDIGAGLGRHSVLALEHRQGLVAVEIKEAAFQQLSSNLSAAIAKYGLNAKNTMVINTDYISCSPDDIGEVDLIIVAGVLQHASSKEDLVARLRKVSDFARKPGARIFIEALLDMNFDGKPPGNTRYAVDQAVFEDHLQEVFPPEKWSLRRLFGPSRKIQDFKHGPTSFIPTAQKVEVTTIEYLIEESLWPLSL